MTITLTTTIPNSAETIEMSMAGKDTYHIDNTIFFAAAAVKMKDSWTLQRQETSRLGSYINLFEHALDLITNDFQLLFESPKLKDFMSPKFFSMAIALSFAVCYKTHQKNAPGSAPETLTVFLVLVIMSRRQQMQRESLCKPC